MSRVGISKSILSISTPGTHLVAGNSKLAAKTARYCNNFASQLKKRHPGRFGYWASLPLPDVDLCLHEIAQSESEGADGFALLTNAHGHYLGSPMFDRVFDELNKRRAIVFIHPTTPCIICESGPVKAAPFQGVIPNPMMEFFFDTARAIINLFYSGTIARCPDIKFIIPHAGGAVPPLLSRFAAYPSLVPGPWHATEETEVRRLFDTQFYFDLAGFPFPGQIKGLMAAGIGPTRLLYGSDFCFTKAEPTIELAKTMDSGVKDLFSDKEIEWVYYRNATELLQSHGYAPSAKL